MYTPDGSGQYAALWTRDFAYMIENGYDLIPQDHIRAAIEYLIGGQRKDGCIPDRVQADGLAVYEAGPIGNPLGDPPTDNSQFLVKAVWYYVQQRRDELFFLKVMDALCQAMDYMPRNSDGLVYIHQGRPRSPYGFTDTVAKTGAVLFSSLLYWEACKCLTSLFRKTHHNKHAAIFEKRAALIEKNLTILWNDDPGIFMAASRDCRQIDTWGNIYALYINFPLGERKNRIVQFLAQNYERFVNAGQVRHLPVPEYWEKTLMAVEPGTYQNGAYWGTASGWLAWSLFESSPEIALQILLDLIEFYKRRGIYECISPGEFKIKDYVVNVVNPFGAIQKMIQHVQ